MAEEEQSAISYPIFTLLLSFAYLFVFLATIIGNAVILIVFICQRRIRSVPNFFLANLTVADLLVGVFCVLQNAAHFVLLSHGRWPFGRFLCHSYIYTLHLIPNVSAGILVLVSVERLVAVLRPLRVRGAFPKRTLITTSAIVWAASAIMNIPYYFASQYREMTDGNETLSYCTRRNIQVYNINVLQVIATVNFVVWYAIPLLTLLFIYATIGVVVSRAADVTKASASKLLPGSSDRTKNGWRSDSSSGGVSVEKRRKVGRLALGIVLSFALLSFPRYAYLMWSVWRPPTGPRCLNCQFHSLLQILSFLLLFLNSAINPFLYAFLSVRFRQCIKDTFTCGSKKPENVVELSSRLRQRKTTPNSEAETAYDDVQ